MKKYAAGDMVDDEVDLEETGGFGRAAVAEAAKRPTYAQQKTNELAKKVTTPALIGLTSISGPKFKIDAVPTVESLSVTVTPAATAVTFVSPLPSPMNVPPVASNPAEDVIMPVILMLESVANPTAVTGLK